jgi:ring-1,2-phenylacetyl-CoA epoxidase subunit PaaD
MTTAQIQQWLEEVKDPEIPVLSIVDLGIITGVEINGDAVTVALTPTFTGCPALDQIKADIRETLSRKGVKDVIVEVTFRTTWTTDRITERGKEALRQFGIAPPVSGYIADLDILEHAICPRCNGNNTEVKNTFGATLCRSIHYCTDCREAFEQFKPL